MKLDKKCECGFNYYKCDKCGKELSRANCYIEPDSDLCKDCYHQVALESQVERMWKDVRKSEDFRCSQYDINDNIFLTCKILSLACITLGLGVIILCIKLFLL